MHTQKLSEKVPIGESYFMNHMFWGRASHMLVGGIFFFIHRTFNLLTATNTNFQIQTKYHKNLNQEPLIFNGNI